MVETDKVGSFFFFSIAIVILLGMQERTHFTPKSSKGFTPKSPKGDFIL
jgi:hypothetical protein